jgi:hypothetical protein
MMDIPEPMTPFVARILALSSSNKTFCGQVLAFQYFSQIKADRPARNSFKTEILQKRSVICFNPDQAGARLPCRR